jgi:hypothetical protein
MVVCLGRFQTHFSSWRAIQLPELDTAALLRGDGDTCHTGSQIAAAVSGAQTVVSITGR